VNRCPKHNTELRVKQNNNNSIQVVVSWIMMLCSDVVGYQHFRGPEDGSSKMLVSYIVTQNHNSENHDMKHHCENLKSHLK